MHKRVPLTYTTDSSQLFSALVDLPWAIYLDSCHPYLKQGRYDILSALPYLTFTTRAHHTTVQNGSHKKVTTADPFTLIKEVLAQAKNDTPADIPFAGGAMGYFAYDLARRYNSLPTQAQADISMPDLAIGFYNWAIVVDHHDRKAHLIYTKESEKTAILIQERLAKNSDLFYLPFQLITALTSNFTYQTYQKAFKKIQQHLREGNCYQVNLAQRFSASYRGHPWNLYQALRKKNPAPFSSFFHLPCGDILSLSPERFLQVKDRIAITKPIKGTRPRGKDSQHDQVICTELLDSEKDRAENLMIVDLLRNDFGKSCRFGSITVPNLFSIETYPAIHHLVSTVQGELAANKEAIDLIRDCFPGGSITGAPKLSAMQIIESLEPHRRGIYCGNMGYLGFNQHLDMNIAIRTLVCTQNKLYYAAGGGIVADSTVEQEYQETFAKVALITKCLQDEGRRYVPVPSRYRPDS